MELIYDAEYFAMRLISRILNRGAPALLGFAVAMTAYSGGLAGVSTAQAQDGAGSRACECLVSAVSTGVIQSVNGNVFVSQTDGSLPARPDMRLRAGSSVLVGPQSGSVISFGRNCTLRLDPGTTTSITPQQGQLCLAVNRQAPGAGGGSTVAGAGAGKFLVPGLMIGGLGLGAVVIATSDKDKGVSR